MRRIAQLREHVTELQDHRLDVLIVLCQRRAAIARWLASHPIPFPLLADEDRSRAKAWGVYAALSYDSINIAKPASFVIDPGGVVLYARVWRHQADPGRLEDLLDLGTR